MNYENRINLMTAKFLEERKHIRRQRRYSQRLSICDKYSVDIVSLLNQGASIYAVWQYLTIRRKLKISYSTVYRYVIRRGIEVKNG